jgi:hypothetical protein
MPVDTTTTPRAGRDGNVRVGNVRAGNVRAGNVRPRIVRQRLAGALADRFRLPGHDDPAPASNHLAGICAWAAVLGLGGMAVALRAFVGLVTNGSAWYAPTVITIGLIGITSTIGAFASVHRPRLPWVLLSVGTAALLTAYLVS